MVYIVIGIVLVVAMSAFLTQRSRRAPETQDAQEPQAPGMESEQSAGVQAQVKAPAGMDIADILSLSPTQPEPRAAESHTAETRAPEFSPAPPAALAEAAFNLEEEIVPLKPILAAEPLSSPNALNSATYTSMAPPTAGDSPYAHGNTVDEAKPKPKSTLLRWSGKAGALQIGNLTIRGPMAYWSEGPSSTPEPSCIDVALPVEYPSGENELPSEGAASYAEMTPLQRGVYLQWLAGGRIQLPPHPCYPLVWLFGLERRVLVDRIDVGLCIGEVFHLLPLIRWDSLRQGFIKFITWMAAKIWLPENELLAFSRTLPIVPSEILNMLLRPYGNARLPLPSIVAFTLMRASSLAEEQGIAQPRPILHSDELLSQFSPKYKSKCEGGLILPKPKTSVFVAYVPTNPTLLGDKKAQGGVLELPDFFKETINFTPLIAAWRDLLKEAFPPKTESLSALDELDARPDWNSFVTSLQEAADGEAGSQDGEIFAGPVMTDLGTLADLVGIPRPKDGKKAEAANRKKISEAARVEGFLILPDMGIAGKEYRWDEPVSLTPLQLGENLSLDYNAAALMLEYACALTGLSDPSTLSVMSERLGDYFPLSSNDVGRLSALSSVLTAAVSPGGETAAEARMDPNNLGEALRFWLPREQRELVGNFLAHFLSDLLTDEQGWLGALRESLDVEITPEQSEEPVSEVAETKENPQLLELGSKVAQALAPLFTDS